MTNPADVARELRQLAKNNPEYPRDAELCRVAADILERMTAEYCVCGHHRAAHSWHTYLFGTTPPSNCSQGCGCQEFRPSPERSAT